MREIFYEYSASAVPPNPTVNSTKYIAPLPYAAGYYKAIAREGGELSVVASKSFGVGVVTDYWKYYKFDNNANDEQGVETVQLNGITSYITGKEGQALQTNSGGTNYARITMPTGDYSVSFWQFLSGSGTGQPISISSSTNSPIPNFVFTLNTNNGTTASYNAYMAGAYQATKTGYDVTQWNHIIVTREGSVQKMYLNGVLVYTATNLYEQTYLYLGNSFSTYNNLKSFDLTRIYQRAITADEVTEIYNAGQ